ncbi:MAG: UxaA family hydrolase [Desulfovibrio sp.]|nr:UxaA family hydrolase [Desulfovibrio sp.]
MDSNDFLNIGGARSALVIHPDDNVAVVLADIAAGESCLVRNSDGTEYYITALEDIGFGHKIALSGIAGEGGVIKYGEEIGRAGKPVAKGAWVHTHNMRCLRGQ